MQEKKFIPQQQIETFNRETFSQWRTETNARASNAAIMIAVGQNKHAGKLAILTAQGVDVGYAINVLRSVADQLEADLRKKNVEQADQIVKTGKRLAWHLRLWKKIKEKTASKPKEQGKAITGDFLN